MNYFVRKYYDQGLYQEAFLHSLTGVTFAQGAPNTMQSDPRYDPLLRSWIILTETQLGNEWQQNNHDIEFEFFESSEGLRFNKRMHYLQGMGAHYQETVLAHCLYSWAIQSAFKMEEYEVAARHFKVGPAVFR